MLDNLLVNKLCNIFPILHGRNLDIWSQSKTIPDVDVRAAGNENADWFPRLILDME